jgi:formate hydrogenlyase subunit 6/NADH:ubiquinone oxidoreductase subunit I
MDEPALHLVPRSGLEQLIAVLRAEQHTVIGPTLREAVIVYDEIASAADLPVGVTDRQSPGNYHVEATADGHAFGYVLGPHSWKRYLFPPKVRLFGATRDGGADSPFTVDVRKKEAPKYAFLGVRACELAAIAIQDRIITGEILDPYYKSAREQAFIVAVNCLEPGGTCFCASMGTGPRCVRGFDLCLTEVNGDLAVEVGSEKGAKVFRQLPSRVATSSERRLFELLLERATEHMGRSLETQGLPELLTKNLESPRWKKIAKRCLACANCTMVCPTCFCYSVHDHTDLTGKKAERWRLWGSCFTLEFSYLGAHTVRTEGASRYRQWMTHKLSSWHQQFGVSGCVGCGRCITWCPVGIDITEEAAAFRKDEATLKEVGMNAENGEPRP